MRLLIRFIFILVYLSINAHQASADTDFDSNAVVAVKIVGKKDFCSGVVVGADEVLTATHCVYDLKTQTYYPTNTMKVGVGDNIVDVSVEDDGIQWFDVSRISSKPSATIKTVSDFLGNDIVSLTTTSVLPVTPTTMASYTSPKTPLTVWGFGEDEWGYYGIKKSRPLENATIDEKLITFSAGACRGDSGGPVLNARNEVVGIVSVSKVPHCVNAGERIAQRISNAVKGR